MRCLCAVHMCDNCVESFSCVVCVQFVGMLVVCRPSECYLSSLCFLCAVRSCFLCCVVPSVCVLALRRVLSVRCPSVAVRLPSHLLLLCSLPVCWLIGACTCSVLVMSVVSSVDCVPSFSVMYLYRPSVCCLSVLSHSRVVFVQSVSVLAV